MRKKAAKKTATHTPTVIAEGTHLLGDIKFYGSLVIEGEITGNVSAQDGGEPSVVVLDKGLVRGKVSAPSILVSGRVKGDIYSSKVVELAAGAVVEGNVYYTVLEVAKGAQVNGSLVLGKPDRDASNSPSNLPGKLTRNRLKDQAIAGVRPVVPPKSA